MALQGPERSSGQPPSAVNKGRGYQVLIPCVGRACGAAKDQALLDFLRDGAQWCGSSGDISFWRGRIRLGQLFFFGGAAGALIFLDTDAGVSVATANLFAFGFFTSRLLRCCPFAILVPFAMR